jgi:cytochrome c oxidase subunit 4
MARGPILVWAVLSALLAASCASAFVPLGHCNAAVNLAFAAAMVMLLATFLMNMRWSSALLRLVALAGLFWLALMFVLTFSDYLSRTGTVGDKAPIGRLAPLLI